MRRLDGVTIKLVTGEDDGRRVGSGTKDPLYLGVHGGNTGGIEFSIHSDRMDNFETGTTNYFAGIVPNGFTNDPNWVPCAITGQYQERGLFRDMNIDVSKIDTVYLRKNANVTEKLDDAYKLKSIEVSLYYINTDTGKAHTKTFSYIANGTVSDGLYLSYETGLKVWLQAGGIASRSEDE